MCYQKQVSQRQEEVAQLQDVLRPVFQLPERTESIMLISKVQERFHASVHSHASAAHA